MSGIPSSSSTSILELPATRAEPAPLALEQPATARPCVRGPFLFVGDEKLVVRGVTYGTFAKNAAGDLFPEREQVRADFEAMRQAHVNTIRTYTLPPDWLFELAREAGLRILVGIFWEGRNCDFDDPARIAEARDAIRAATTRGRRFPEVVLAYVIANEIPPLVVRFHGRRVVERHLRDLHAVAKAEDPDGLVTYGNYPTTEYLELDFLDFHTMNVYLLERGQLSNYLDRLMIQTKGKPLLIGEIGEDSYHKDEQAQAQLLDWTLPLAFGKGVCGLCIFGWTDDWVVGGHAIEDWRFGLVDAQRNPKQALAVAARHYGEHPLEACLQHWPRVSVIVCNYNGAATLAETLVSLQRLDYPDHEIVYVDDGSTDESLTIAHAANEHGEKPIHIVAQANQGLSVARNVGARAARGEIVAYIDSDAYADRDWLRFLVLALQSGPFSGAGGPNLTPASDGLAAQFVALCPGNPTYVLRDNVHAEHIAGVNMAFQREALLALGGFDPVHTRAGDDVDVCWRFENANQRLAFAPAAIVWHHRRPSALRYLKQQAGYGEAENQLERKHPDRFNRAGYIRWRGCVYLAQRRSSFFSRPFVYHGFLGQGLFQTLYQKEPSWLLDGPSMIQWYQAGAALLLVGPFAPWLALVGGAMLLVSLWVAFLKAYPTQVPVPLTARQQMRKTVTLTLLNFLFPVVRWYGRFSARVRRLRPLRMLARHRWLSPLTVMAEIARYQRCPKPKRSYWGQVVREEVLALVHERLRKNGNGVAFARDWSNYDLLLSSSVLAEGRIYSAPEHYGQALCFGFRARATWLARWLLSAFLVVALAAPLLDVRLAALLALPLCLWIAILYERARLQRQATDTIEAVMGELGAKRFHEH